MTTHDDTPTEQYPPSHLRVVLSALWFDNAELATDLLGELDAPTLRRLGEVFDRAGQMCFDAARQSRGDAVVIGPCGPASPVSHHPHRPARAEVTFDVDGAL
jgi:hypothetical protein